MNLTPRKLIVSAASSRQQRLLWTVVSMAVIVIALAVITIYEALVR